MKKSNDNEIVFADIIPGENGLIDGDFVLQLFNLHKEDVEDLSCIHQADGIYVFITLAARKHECPYCTTPTKKSKAITPRRSPIRSFTTSTAILNTMLDAMNALHAAKHLMKTTPSQKAIPQSVC
jgi:hypothetical protein